MFENVKIFAFTLFLKNSIVSKLSDDRNMFLSIKLFILLFKKEKTSDSKSVSLMCTDI